MIIILKYKEGHILGYVRPEISELKMREYTVYKAHYCGVCHSLKKCGGIKCTSILSYDASMLALVCAIYSCDESLIMRRCVVNPLKKQATAVGSAENYAADINLIYAYLKCVDDIQDKNSTKAKIGKFLLKKPARKAIDRNLALFDKTVAELDTLSKLERDGCDDLDEVSLCSGRALAFAFEECSKDKNQGQALNWLGLNIGRWVYLCDAIEDFEEDIQNSSFNVLVNRYGDIDRMKNDKQILEYNLLYSLGEANKALDLLRDNPRKSILSNIISESCVNITENLVNTGKPNLPTLSRNKTHI